MCIVFETGKTYKLQDCSGTYYTATILSESEFEVVFLDKDGIVNGLKKLEIKRWKEVVE